MSRFLLTPAALEGLRSIVSHIAVDSPRNAELVAILQLTQHDIGHVREELTTRTLKFWTVHSALIAYVPKTMPVRIVGTRIIKQSFDVASQPLPGHPPDFPTVAANQLYMCRSRGISIEASLPGSRHR